MSVNRKIIQIIIEGRNAYHTYYALCDDGTLWSQKGPSLQNLNFEINSGKWQKVSTSAITEGE